MNVAVVPAKATNLTLLEKTHDRVLIQWSLVTPMMNFPPGVVQRVEYKSQWDAKDYWEVRSKLNIYIVVLLFKIGSIYEAT